MRIRIRRFALIPLRYEVQELSYIKTERYWSGIGVVFDCCRTVGSRICKDLQKVNLKNFVFNNNRLDPRGRFRVRTQQNDTAPAKWYSSIWIRNSATRDNSLEIFFQI
jgi:hypothetical protein